MKSKYKSLKLKEVLFNKKGQIRKGYNFLFKSKQISCYRFIKAAV